jgi:hypothetical protein
MVNHGNAELREILSNPDVYTPEAVHGAARELATRHAVPRYYTRLQTSHFSPAIKVGRTWNPNLITKLQILFSEKRLKVVCMIIVVTHFPYIALRGTAYVGFLMTLTPGTFLKHFEYILSNALALITSIFVTVFFFILHRTLSIRSINVSKYSQS